jgi:hypothetical protein
VRPLPFVVCCVLSVAAAATFPSLALAQTAPAAPPRRPRAGVPDSEDLVAPKSSPKPVRPWSG